MILLKYVYNITKYSLERTKTVRIWAWWKNHHDATTLKWTTSNCWFETLSDKLQNVSQSLSVL